MFKPGRSLTLIACALIASVAALVIGYAIADPIATALGFLVLFATATGGLPLLVVGVVIWVIGARSQRCQARTTT